MIKTTRLNIVPATYSDIAMIISIEKHKDNCDYIWTGTEDEHKNEIDASDYFCGYLKLVMKKLWVIRFVKFTQNLKSLN